MALWVKCLLRKHMDWSSSPMLMGTHVNSRWVWPPVFNLSTAGRHRSPKTRWLTRLVNPTSSGFPERSSLSIEGEERQKKHPTLTSGFHKDTPTHAMHLHSAHTHTCMHTYTHREKESKLLRESFLFTFSNAIFIFEFIHLFFWDKVSLCDPG